MDSLLQDLAPTAPAPRLPIEPHDVAVPAALKKVKKGTTTLAMRIREGIVICVDSRATAGSFVSSWSVKKFLPISRNIVGTMAGGAADCQYWERELSRQCRLYDIRNKPPISVAAASKLLSSMLFQYRGRDLSLGTMISGYDTTGPHIFYVDNEGLRLEGNFFSVGSGSPYAMSIVDPEYDFEMPKEKALDLAQRAVLHATHRDIASGGTVNRPAPRR